LKARIIYTTLFLFSTERTTADRQGFKQILTQFNSILGQNTLLAPKFGYMGWISTVSFVTNRFPSRRNHVCRDNLSSNFLLPFNLFYLVGHCTLNGCWKKKIKHLKPNSYINFQYFNLARHTQNKLFFGPTWLLSIRIWSCHRALPLTEDKMTTRYANELTEKDMWMFTIYSIYGIFLF